MYGSRSARRRLRCGRAQGALMSHHSAPNPVDLWTTQERALPTNPQVQQQQQASAYSVRNGVERVPTLDPHANPVSEIHRPASRRTPGRDHPGIPGRLRRNPHPVSAQRSSRFTTTVNPVMAWKHSSMTCRTVCSSEAFATTASNTGRPRTRLSSRLKRTRTMISLSIHIRR